MMSGPLSIWTMVVKGYYLSLQGIVGSSLGQKAEGNVHLGNQMSGGTSTGLLGKGGRIGQMGSRDYAVEAK